MTTKDKIAMILTTRNFSLAEGAAMYDELMASDKKYIVKVCPKKNVVVWLERGWSDGDESKVHVVVWLNYERDFCHNYALAGAVALGDDDLSIEEEESKKFMDFFISCKRIYSDTADLPVLPDDLQWIFTMAPLTDYMESDEYEVGDDTEINIKVEQTINGI